MEHNIHRKTLLSEDLVQLLAQSLSGQWSWTNVFTL